MMPHIPFLKQEIKGTSRFFFTSPDLFHFWKCFDTRPKASNYPITDQIWSQTTIGLFSWTFCMTVNTRVRVVKHTRWKKFRCERKLWTPSLLAGVNHLQEKRNVSLICVCMGQMAIYSGADLRGFYSYCSRGVISPWPR